MKRTNEHRALEHYGGTIIDETSEKDKASELDLTVWLENSMRELR
jgi:hypothetical protein